MTEKRLIEWETLKENCRYLVKVFGFCDNSTVEKIECQMNTCPIWKNLSTIEDVENNDIEKSRII